MPIGLLHAASIFFRCPQYKPSVKFELTITFPQLKLLKPFFYNLRLTVTYCCCKIYPVSGDHKLSFRTFHRTVFNFNKSFSVFVVYISEPVIFLVVNVLINNRFKFSAALRDFFKIRSKELWF